MVRFDATATALRSEPTRRERLALFTAACAFAAAPLSGFFMAAWNVQPQHTCRVLVTTDSGDLYVAGSGDTCAEAVQHMDVPDDWRTIRIRMD